MADTANIPWKMVPSDLGDVPFYVIKFDKHGKCTSPVALEHLVETSKTKTDVFVFSHGWNNDWDAATRCYDRFVQRFIEVRRERWSRPNRSFAPVLAGVFWPSAALVAPWESGPDIAAADEDDPDVAALAGELAPDSCERFRRIVAQPSAHNPADLAKILAPALSGDSDELGVGAGPVSAEDLLAVWQAVADHHDRRSTEQAGPTGGFIDDSGDAAVPAAPAAWDPIRLIRDGIRATTVLLMKDRAGRVGGTGVAEMLRRLANASSESRISLVGHSYGAKVVLSALCNAPAPSRKIDSVLLLQAALSCFAFVEKMDGIRGGYRPALERVRLPIVTTYSRRDEPLTRLFHLAAWRKSDLAEAVIAAPGQPPSKFAALGGYGPHGVDDDVEWIDMPVVGDAYPIPTDKRIVAVDGTEFIKSHGAVAKRETVWALLCQIRS